jgi:hypothetical protein
VGAQTDRQKNTAEEIGLQSFTEITNFSVSTGMLGTFCPGTSLSAVFWYHHDYRSSVILETFHATACKSSILTCATTEQSVAQSFWRHLNLHCTQYVWTLCNSNAIWTLPNTFPTSCMRRVSFVL